MIKVRNKKAIEKKIETYLKNKGWQAYYPDLDELSFDNGEEFLDSFYCDCRIGFDGFNNPVITSLYFERKKKAVVSFWNENTDEIKKVKYDENTFNNYKEEDGWFLDSGISDAEFTVRVNL